MKTVQLGELEKQIMDIVWEQKQCSTRDVLTKLSGKKLAYTTVATILQRLHNKGLIDKKNHKNGYKYCPKVSRKLYSENFATSFLEKFISSFGNLAISSFAESIDKLPKEKREYFLKILEEQEHKK